MDAKYSIKALLDVLSSYKWVELHVHHTWKPDHNDFNGSNHQSLQDGMRNYHMKKLGWSDIGQHLTLFPDGYFLTGRDFGRSPASISGQNKVGALAVEMLGNFDIGNDVFGGDQKNSMLELAKWFIDLNLPIKFHNQYSDKTCPGTSINYDEFIKEATHYGEKVDQSTIPSSWASEAWQWGIDNKVISGGDPKKIDMTKEEIITMIYRAVKA